MRILAGMSLLMSVSSVTYGGFATVQEHCVEMEKSNASRHSISGTTLKLKLRILEFFKLNPWKNKAFAVWAVSLSFIAFGNFIPFVFLVSTTVKTFTVFFQRPLALAKGLGKPYP